LLIEVERAIIIIKNILVAVVVKFMRDLRKKSDKKQDTACSSAMTVVTFDDEQLP
jgi:hypothetical protein